MEGGGVLAYLAQVGHLGCLSTGCFASSGDLHISAVRYIAIDSGTYISPVGCSLSGDHGGAHSASGEEENGLGGHDERD